MEFLQTVTINTLPNNIFIYLSLLLFILTLYLMRRKSKIEQEVNKKVEVLKKAFDVSEESIFILSNKYKILYTNKAMKNLFLTDKNSTLAVMPKIKVKKEWEALDTFISNISKGSKEKTFTFPRSKLRINNSKKEISINLFINSSSSKNADYHVVTIQNLTKEYEQKLTEYKHKLTMLPNKFQALMDLNAIYTKMHLGQTKLAVVMISIDNFSQLRAIIGYEQSNVILTKFARYLETFVDKTSINAYHTCHNNYLLTILNEDSQKNILLLCQNIQKELGLFYKLDSIKLHLSASIGVSIYAQTGSSQSLLDNAYKALAESEKKGFGRLTIYETKKRNSKYTELELYNSVHEAIEKNEFIVYYQPIIDVKAKKIVAAEALIRWIHPEYGFIPPDVFIPILEKTGFIVDLGRYVLEEVFTQQKRWESFGFKEVQVAINMSLFEIETEGFVKNVERKLKEHKLNPKLIKFEITEGAAMKSEKVVLKQLMALKSLGLSISLDDFGTGYTSFSYLKKFPADILKIDKSFIDHIIKNEEDQRIVKAMIELGHNLGMKIIVEGIETKEMVEMIASYGCDYMQGYFFSKPLPVFEFQELLRKR